MTLPIRRFWLAGTLGLMVCARAVAAGGELTGTVVGADDQPIADATVFINTAGPRIGVSVFCPSCYADCGKKATTDAEGRFAIDGLDATLVFSLVATAEGYRAKLVARVDPAHEQPKLRLTPLPTNIAAECAVRGRVVDASGKPVVGAEVTPYGCKTSEQRWWGQLKGVDLVSITNAEGAFLLVGEKPAEGYDLEVRSPRHAAKRFALVATGDEVHQLAVEGGTLVRGRLMKAGKAVSGVQVGLVQTDRNVDGFLGKMDIGSRADGSFEFTYVPAHTDYYAYTEMSSMGGAGSLPLRRVTSGDNDTVVELGDVELGPAVALAGHIELADGRPIHGPIQLLLSREGAWDSQTMMVGDDGQFRFENVPESEPVTFVARVPGYRLSSSRNRFQQTRENSLAMFVEGPREEIVIYYEPEQSAAGAK